MLGESLDHIVPTLATIRSQLVRPKDKTSPEKKTGVVYDISCNGCGEYCIGETSRALGKRLGEHPQKQTASAVWEHQSTTQHEIDWEGIKILDQETGDIKRKIKKVIHNRRQRPTLNRDGDYELPAISNHLLSRDKFPRQHCAFTADEDCVIQSKATRLKSETLMLELILSSFFTNVNNEISLN